MGASAARGVAAAVMAHRECFGLLDRRIARVASRDAMRRRQIPRYDADPANLPEGWQLHDGGPCPVDPDAKPALMFRDGRRVRIGDLPARHWIGWEGRATGSCWEWQDDPFDIVAYQLEESADA